MIQGVRRFLECYWDINLMCGFYNCQASIVRKQQYYILHAVQRLTVSDINLCLFPGQGLQFGMLSLNYFMIYHTF